jgi:hypothetical protein
MPGHATTDRHFLQAKGMPIVRTVKDANNQCQNAEQAKRPADSALDFLKESAANELSSAFGGLA